MFRIITGIVVILIGLWFAYLAVTETWWMLIHATFIASVGIAILLNNREDEIEEIKKDNQE